MIGLVRSTRLYGDQRNPKSFDAIVVLDIPALELAGVQHLAELGGFPGESMIGDGNRPRTARTGYEQAPARIKASVAASSQDQMQEALLVNLLGGAIIRGGSRLSGFHIQDWPSLHRRAVVEIDALCSVSLLQLLGRREVSFCSDEVRCGDVYARAVCDGRQPQR